MVVTAVLFTRMLDRNKKPEYKGPSIHYSVGHSLFFCFFFRPLVRRWFCHFKQKLIAIQRMHVERAKTEHAKGLPRPEKETPSAQRKWPKRITGQERVSGDHCHCIDLCHSLRLFNTVCILILYLWLDQQNLLSLIWNVATQSSHTRLEYNCYMRPASVAH